MCYYFEHKQKYDSTESGMLESTFPSEKAPTKKQPNTASNWLSENLPTVKGLFKFLNFKKLHGQVGNTPASYFKWFS
jgi:hypothetical protein